MTSSTKSFPQAARERAATARRLQTRNTARVHHVDTRRVTEADLDAAQAWRNSPMQSYATWRRARAMLAAAVAALQKVLR